MDKIPTRDELPFRAFQSAHRRFALAQLELRAARAELEQAFGALQDAGYIVRQSEPGDELSAVAPIPADRFRGETG